MEACGTGLVGMGLGPSLKGKNKTQVNGKKKKQDAPGGVSNPKST
jgi:hypothetical protein